MVSGVTHGVSSKIAIVSTTMAQNSVSTPASTTSGRQSSDASHLSIVCAS
jgi:hypothetical protein